MSRFSFNKSKNMDSSDEYGKNNIILFPTNVTSPSQFSNIYSPSKKAQHRLEKYANKAQSFLANEKKMDKFLLRLESKLKKIPQLGDKLAYITVFAELLNNYLHKTYPNVPMGTIIAVVGALLYYVSPIDAIPDFILGLGYLDDAGVVVACFALIKSDIDEYLEWRAEAAIDISDG